MVEEAHATAMREIQQKADCYLVESNLVHDQNIDKLNNTIRDLRNMLSKPILRMTLADLFSMKLGAFHDVTTNCTADMTSVSNQTASCGSYAKSRAGDEGTLSAVYHPK